MHAWMLRQTRQLLWIRRETHLHQSEREDCHCPLSLFLANGHDEVPRCTHGSRKVRGGCIGRRLEIGASVVRPCKARASHIRLPEGRHAQLRAAQRAVDDAGGGEVRLGGKRVVEGGGVDLGAVQAGGAEVAPLARDLGQLGALPPHPGEGDVGELDLREGRVCEAGRASEGGEGEVGVEDGDRVEVRRLEGCLGQPAARHDRDRGEVGSGEGGADALHCPKGGLAQRGGRQVCAVQRGAVEGRVVEGCLEEGGLVERGAVEGGLRELGATQARAVELRVEEGGAPQVCVVENCAGEVRAVESRPLKVCAAQVCPLEEEAALHLAVRAGRLEVSAGVNLEEALVGRRRGRRRRRRGRWRRRQGGRRRRRRRGR
mmetsp:Transcript_6652/g.21316  ORF Transcript_6652/g.21316 Transcript_6652/m.21316 type:complete len:373 (+) Transcript_6652:84-1202(+)